MVRSICQWLWADRKFGNAFLHHFHRSDQDVGESGTLLLHNHPFIGFSIILVGGYTEERRRYDDTIETKTYLPGSINYLNKQDFHRVDLLQSDGWSLFFTGPRSDNRSWGFWDRITKEFKDFKHFAKAVE